MAIRVVGSRQRAALRALAGMFIVSLLAGCSTFKASKRLDVGPFAENTVGMIGEVQRATKPVVWIHLKKYDNLPAVADARRAYAPARTLMRGVALYSTQVVSVYESSLPEERKAAELVMFGRRATISVRPSRSLARRLAVELVPMPDGRALIAFDAPQTVAEFELRLHDALDDGAITDSDREACEAMRAILRDARRSDDIALAMRNIIVLESRPAGRRKAGATA